ncbi:MAG: ATP-binding protein [Bryobacterales bacterium]|nr:ATP-binding protein [Bryobacterales bacterium]
MSRAAREHFPHRADGRGEELYRGCPGAESLPGWIQCAVDACQRLIPRLGLGAADGSLRNLLVRLWRIDVLIVDDWAMAPLNEPERREFWEICEDLYQTRSTVLTSQAPVAQWHAQIGDPSLADSILDRLVHNAHRIELKGESLRKKKDKKDRSLAINSSSVSGWASERSTLSADCLRKVAFLARSFPAKRSMATHENMASPFLTGRFAVDQSRELPPGRLPKEVLCKSYTVSPDPSKFSSRQAARCSRLDECWAAGLGVGQRLARVVTFGCRIASWKAR